MMLWFSRLGLFGSLVLLLWTLAGCTVNQLPVPVAISTPVPLSDPEVRQADVELLPAAVLRYRFWDAALLPAYTACAEQFMALHPQITVVVEQIDGTSYWGVLRDELTAGTAPDVFVNHLTQMPELAAANQLYNLQPLFERDGLDETVYINRASRLWMRAGERYGLPQDWSTVALVYNRDLLAEAGVAPEQLETLDWNPRDGGSLVPLLASLTVDMNGQSALSPAFQAADVAYYGMTLAGQDSGGAYGQQQWSYLAAANGFRFVDFQYANSYFYDAPALIESLTWLQWLINQSGYHTPFAEIVERGGRSLFLEGRAVLVADTSRFISQYVAEAPFAVGFAPLPSGPQGRLTMFDGLANSIVASTPSLEQAWLWTQYLSSVSCQLTIGEQGVTFPVLESGVERMVDQYLQQGIDVTAFTRQVLSPKGTFFHPVTEHATEIAAILQPVLAAILSGEGAPADLLPIANQKVNALFAP